MKRLFYRLVELSQRHAWLIIAVAAVVTGVMGWFAVQIRPDPELTTMSPEDPRVTRLTEKYGAANKAENFLIIVARDPALFTPGKLALLDEALSRLPSLEGVRPGITPFTFPIFVKEKERLVFGSAAPGGRAPTTADEAARFRELLLANPQAHNLVISGDGSALAAYLPVDPADDFRPLLARAESVLAPLASAMDIRISGGLPFSAAMQNHIYGDLPVFLSAALAVILVSYFLSFRTKRSLILPVTVVVLGATWTTGTMTLLGFRLSVVMVMTPPLVLILGSSYSLHMLNQYYRDTRGLARGHKDWIVKSVARITITIFLASSTTVFGFLSLLSASLRQVREFGIATAIGIVYCALLALFLLPAVLSLLPAPTPRQTNRVREGLLARWLMGLADVVMRGRWVVVAVGLLIGAGFAVAITKVRYQTDFTKYFRYREQAVENNQILIDQFTGFETVYFTLSAPDGDPGYFQDPAVLASIARLEDRILADPDVKYLMSFGGFLRSLNAALTGTPTVPDSRGPVLLLAKYVSAISSTPVGKAIAGNLVNRDFSRYTLTIHVWDHEQRNLAFEDQMARILPRIKAMARSMLPQGVEAEFWGSTITVLSTSELLNRDQVTSIISSAALVCLASMLIFRSVRHGVVVLAPLAVGIMLDFILMGIFSIKLDVVTITFASIAIGIGVDNAIHLVVWYRRERRIYPEDPRMVIRQTLKIAGRPMILTTLSITAALLVFVFSAFWPVVYFGILISSSLVLTTAAALVVLPALLYLGARQEMRQRGRLAARR